jgi:hypothetical protein
MLDVPDDRLAHAGEPRQLDLGKSGLLPVTLNQLG